MQRSQQLRTATQTRRSARSGFPEPDDFEGLPVRQWRQEWVHVAPSAPQEMTQQSDRWAVELPYGMPRESHLLPPHSQELLRAARSGRLYKRPAPVEEEEPDADIDPVKGDKKDWDPPNDGYVVKMWKQMPRNAEVPEISHLAKRHKNTVTLASKTVAPQATGPTVIRATVRRIDAAGNPYEQTVTLTEGQQVDGEIISTSVVPAPAATQQEPPAQQPTPVRRRPPPPKRKAKGPGRGRRKGKLPLPLPTTRSQAAAAAAGDGTPSVDPETGIKVEDTEDSTNQDSEMVDVSGMPSEDEGEAGEGEEEEEGDEEAGDEEVAEASNADEPSVVEDRGLETEDSEMSEAIQPGAAEDSLEPRPKVEEPDDGTASKARFQPPSLANLGSSASSKIEGSPLKNVMIISPTEPSPNMSPTPNASLAATNQLETQPQTKPSDSIAGQAPTSEETAPGALPSLRDHVVPTHAGNSQGAAAGPSPPRPVEDQPEPMVTDDAPGLSQASAEITTDAAKPPSPPAVAPAPSEGQGQGEAPAPPNSNPQSTASPVVTPTGAGSTETAAASQPPPPPPPAPAAAAAPATETTPPPAAAATAGPDDDEDGLNLLGSLERELDRQQEGMSGASAGGGGGVSDAPRTADAPGAEEAAQAEPQPESEQGGNDGGGDGPAAAAAAATSAAAGEDAAPDAPTSSS
ncbi:hypothetical protein VTH82DRAFT_7642 [Thermothelomyces myriococcoides]